ncbi:unnamed protein product, partial [Hymenolepis diminuta]
MRDIFHLPIPLCEEENFAQTSDSPHKSSTSEASVKLRTDETVRSESDLGRSNVLIPTSDCSPTASIREDNAQTSNFSPWTSTTEPSTNVKTARQSKYPHKTNTQSQMGKFQGPFGITLLEKVYGREGNL